MTLAETGSTIPIGFVPSSREDWIRLANAENAAEVLDAIPPEKRRDMLNTWSLFAHAYQWPPAGDWTTWLMLGGRGAGKTRAGAEWIVGQALGLKGFAPAPVERIALIGETMADVRDVMVQGPSGILGVVAEKVPRWIGTKRRLEWPDGQVALAFSSEDPESLRGPQFGAAWCDELAKWKHAEATFDMLQFGLRLGSRPRQMVTTTPRPIPLVRRLLDDAGDGGDARADNRQ